MYTYTQKQRSAWQIQTEKNIQYDELFFKKFILSISDFLSIYFSLLFFHKIFNTQKNVAVNPNQFSQ